MSELRIDVVSVCDGVQDTLPPLASAAIDNLIMRYQAMGWRTGALAPETEVLDRLIYEAAPCRRCGANVLYIGFNTRIPRAYRVFTVCVGCGETRERGNDANDVERRLR